MNELDFQIIENEFGFTLPNHYKEFQKNYPSRLIDLKINLEMLWNSADRILEYNRHLFEVIKSQGFLAIGVDLGGNFYLISLYNSDKAVYTFDHEAVEEFDLTDFASSLSKIGENLIDFAESLINDYGDLLQSMS